MTVKMMDNIHNYIGLSSDTKPASPLTGSIFFETDTKQKYIYIGSAWVIMDREFFDISERPVRAQGTTDGVQYDAEVVTVVANTDVILLAYDSSTNYPKLAGNLSRVEYDIYFQLKAGSATADLKWQLWARNKGGTWTIMCAEQSADNIGTSYVDKRIAGLLDIKTNITTVPFEMKLTFQSNEATPGIATGKIRDDSVIRMVGEIA
jgi:hypothetical protein